MSILRHSPRGFVRTIVLIVVLILVLFYLGIDVNNVVEVIGRFFKTMIDLIVHFVKTISQMIRDAI
ncbi:MAG: hypothetical protein Q8P93_01975 [bacterium]|nr:hypothetical protein [bacterium]